MKHDNEKFCGLCCWFYAEDTYGYGACPFQFAEVRECGQPCNRPSDFVSREQMRHHIAVLTQANRYRRDPHVPAIYRMPDPKQLGEAIDFAVKYVKTMSDL